MTNWVKLFEAIEASNKTNEKLAALITFFNEANEDDKLWLIALFTGRKPKKPIKAGEMRQWAAEASGVEEWLFEECYAVVGDVAETIALLMQSTHEKESISLSLSALMSLIIDIGKMDTEQKKENLLAYWKKLDKASCFLFNKMMTGGFRIGVSQHLLVQALAKHLHKTVPEVTHRLTGNWSPLTLTFQDLLLDNTIQTDFSKPYPFYLAYPIEQSPQELGPCEDWVAEWKWDGIRCQLIKRNKEVFLWSRGEELITNSFPELKEMATHLPDGIALDGELMAWNNGEPLPFALLQKRINRKKPSKRLIAECPCVFMAYDVLEYEGKDQRNLALSVRKQILYAGFSQPLDLLQLSPSLTIKSWEEATELRENSRAMKAEGLMIKRADSIYQSGRKRGDWWKWKMNPYTIDAVLVYAQKGHGRRADLFTDYTFAVWHQDKLLTFTKAYSGLTDKELVAVDQFVKKNTLEKFGPVRTVTPQLVFEIGFEGIQESSRHKCGVALRFPRIIRWRTDKQASEANTLDDLKQLL